MTRTPHPDPPDELEWERSRERGKSHWKSGRWTLFDGKEDGWVIHGKRRRAYLYLDGFKSKERAKTCAAWLERG